MTKFCNQCDTDKPIDEFSKKASNKDGLRNQCKVCCGLNYKQYVEKNQNKVKMQRQQYREEYREKIRDDDKSRYAGLPVGSAIVYHEKTYIMLPKIEYEPDDEILLTEDDIMLNIVEKKCSGCGDMKKLIEFHKDSSTSTGRRSECIVCRKTYPGYYKPKTRSKKYKKYSASYYMRKKIMDTELWVDIPGLEDFFFISSRGQVKNCEDEILPLDIWKQKQYVTIFKETYSVTELVAKSFCIIPVKLKGKSLYKINYKDNDWINNSANNLEYISVESTPFVKGQRDNPDTMINLFYAGVFVGRYGSVNVAAKDRHISASSLYHAIKKNASYKGYTGHLL